MELIVGNWYRIKQGTKYENIIKYIKGSKRTNICANEYINIKNILSEDPYYKKTDPISVWSDITEISEASIQEFSHLLPDGHPDKDLMKTVEIW